MLIRPESSADHDAIAQLNRAAFESDAEAKLVDALRDGRFLDLSLVGEIDGQIVGHICFSPALIRGTSAIWQATSLAPMAVLPEHQRQGLGSELVQAGLSACRRDGHRISIVLGHPDFYPRFGFSAELARPLLSPFGSGESWMAAELLPNSLRHVRGRVEYAPPFDAFK